MQASKPQASEDYQALMTIEIARLTARHDFTPESYRACREKINRIPGVDIRRLPRDAEYGYEEPQA